MAEYYRSKDVFFVNPFNFVSINTESEKRKDIKQQYEKKEQFHTGYLRCKMYVKTPLAIPDSEKKKVTEISGKEHKEYPFYSIDGKVPVIPGSSIRGMIRSVYETATDSCMVTVKENMGMTARIDNKRAFLPGLLIYEKGEWKLYSAKRYLIPIEGRRYKAFQNFNREGNFQVQEESGQRYLKSGDVKFRNGDCVNFTLFSQYQPYKKGNYIIWNGIVETLQRSEKGDAYVFIGEEFPSRKHGESLFKKCALIEVEKGKIQDALEGLEETIKVYQNPAINRNYSKEHSGYANFENAKKRGVIPIWFREEDKTNRQEGHLYFSAASIGRKQYEKRLIDLIGSKKPCEKRSCLCKACLLFGMAKGQESVGSRVRIGDAKGESYSLERNVTLQELGMPRSSYMPFYAEKQGIRYRESCVSYDEQGAVVRGRKFYWHNPKAENDSSVYTTKEKTERNSTVDLVMPGAVFNFKVYYDGITEQQLNELIWTVTFWENEENGVLCHKLGHGKPLGLGSVKMTVAEKVERIVKDEGYQLIHSEVILGDTPPISKNLIYVKELLRICNYQALQGEDIRYPYVKLDTAAEKMEKEKKKQGKEELKENILANHQWFTQNRGTRGDSPDACVLASVLEKQKLPVYYVKNLQDKDFQQKKREKNSNAVIEQRSIGTVKFFNVEKNFGFVRTKDGKECFVSGREIKEDELNKIKTGIKIDFVIEKEKKGFIARKCRIIET